MSFFTPFESDDVVELSSDEELITLETNRLPNPRDRSSSPVTNCSICLDDFTNKCYTNSCSHLFCFECLKRWSTTKPRSKPSCPLCKQRFNRIFHSFDDQGNHQIYNVPRRNLTEPISRAISPIAVPTIPMTGVPFNLMLDVFRRHERRLHEMINNMGRSANLSGPANGNGQFNNANQDFISPPMTGQGVRIQVYAENAWALPLPDPYGRFKECNSTYFRNNPAEVRALQPFITRDLIALKETASVAHGSDNICMINVPFVTNLILRTLTSYDIREGFMINILRPYLHWRTLHFCHEFYNFAHSPYDMADYDRNVQFSFESSTEFSLDLPPLLGENRFIDLSAFASPPPPTPAIPLESSVQRVIGEIIVLDSDSEESQLQELEVITISSGSDDSDVDIIVNSRSDDSEVETPTIHSIESLNSALVDQPSTSTGIRDSLDRPRSMVRLNLKRRRLYERFDADSSSSDEE